MKLTKFLFIATTLMVVTIDLIAQSNIENTFQDIIDTNGIQKSISESKINQIDDDNEKSKIEHSKIIDVLIGKQYFNLFNEIKEAFENDRDDAYLAESCYGPISESNTRRIWKINRESGDNIFVGNEYNSNYVIVCFNDPFDSELRTVYSAEWWDTDDPNIRKGRLIYCYGAKPKSQTNNVFSLNIPHGVEFDSIFNQISNDIELNDMQQKLLSRPDTLFKGEFWKKPSYITNLRDLRYGTTIIPNQSDYKIWIANAYDRLKKLNESEWLQLFGLLTEHICELSDDKGRDLIVASSMVLDLCKNVPSKLDEGERWLCVKRLSSIAKSLETKNEYVHDILSLCAEKLDK